MKGRRARSLETVWRWARTLRPARVGGKALPRLFFLTDPARTPDPEAVIRRLPRGAGVVYRAFGDPRAVVDGRRLVKAARRRGLLLLAGADANLAARIGADGVHLPQRMAMKARGLKRSHRTWIITAAAHSGAAIATARRNGADAVFVSPVFESASPSAGRPIGSLRFAALTGQARMPVFALGGLNANTTRRLAGGRAAGFAAVEALLD
ncbi:MAG TPA: thiamine phosphate synthase [Caulobacteraceae bacterium]|nr:thiamine phosphate synthase [Caulobacteraceae bacterium]